MTTVVVKNICPADIYYSDSLSLASFKATLSQKTTPQTCVRSLMPN